MLKFPLNVTVEYDFLCVALNHKSVCIQLAPTSAMHVEGDITRIGRAGNIDVILTALEGRSSTINNGSYVKMMKIEM